MVKRELQNEFKRHQKWPCVLGIGANVEDRGCPLVLLGAHWGSALGQMLSVKGPDGVVGQGGGEVGGE